MKIGIDCGHTLSGADYGASGIKEESKLTREVGTKVIAKLQSLGHTVIKCYKDSFSSLTDSLSYRTNTANRNNVDLYVSIHFNCYNGSAHGTEIFTYRGKRTNKATNVLNNIVALGYTNRGIKDGSNLYVIRNTKAEAMLIECCFCDNRNDMNKFNSEKVANAIVKGLVGKTINVTNNNKNISTNSSSYPLLRKGSRGSYVKKFQSMLIKIGYPVGPYGDDGVFGNGTLTAVRAFQRDCNLVVDGIVGNNTWKALEKNIR